MLYLRKVGVKKQLALRKLKLFYNYEVTHMKVNFPYGKEYLSLDIPESRLQGVLVSNLHHYEPKAAPLELVEEALKNPIGSAPLCELAKGKKNVVLIASDHTRPGPSKVIVPPMLREIRKGNPDADITILISTGCHRETTMEELVNKFGQEIVDTEKIVVHDCDQSPLVKIGTLPSGGECIVNKLVVDADLVVSEGFIEPHFFAGFSGARKSILPGIASRTTVLANHCSEFIAHPCARTGILEGNPIHEDMLFAARKAGLKFIVNTVIDPEKRILRAFAGDVDAAHLEGVDFCRQQAGVTVPEAEIVISSNGGYPLDMNVYQAVKGMTAAEAVCRPGGVIIMVAGCCDGHGGESFYRHMAAGISPDAILQEAASHGRNDTLPDQWQYQILARILQKYKVIMVAPMCDRSMLKEMMLDPAPSPEAALKMAFEYVGSAAKVAVLPDGVSVIPVKAEREI